MVGIFSLPLYRKKEKRNLVKASSKDRTFKSSVPDLEDGGNIGGSRIHFPSVPGKYLADLRSRANSQQYSSIYED